MQKAVTRLHDDFAHTTATHWSPSPQTGVERRMLGEKLKLEWKYGQRKKTPQSFILSNVDYLKRYNDTYDHQKGDDCRHAMAGALGQAAFRSANRVSRYDSEEFALIMPIPISSASAPLPSEFAKR